MSSLGRNDAFSVVGGAPAARFVEGHVSRVTGTQVFVISPTFDSGAEFGPVRYSGRIPPVGAECLLAVVTATTEAWIISWDGPVATPPPTTEARACKLVATANQAAPPNATFVQMGFDAVPFNFGDFTFRAGSAPYTTGRLADAIIIPTAGLYRFHGSAAYQANTQLVSTWLFCNGAVTWADGSNSQFYSGATLSNGIYVVSQQVVQTAECAAGDVITLIQDQTTSVGGPFATVARYTWLTAEKLERAA